MAEGRDRADWARASMIAANIFNAQRSRKRDKVWKPEHFDPYAAADGRRPTAGMPINADTFGLVGLALTGRLPPKQREKQKV
jgi:hypothetical protein